MICLLIPTLALVYFGQLPGRIIGLIIFMIFAVIGIYEVSNFMTNKIWTILLFSIFLLLSTVLLPYNSFSTLFLDGLPTESNLRSLIFYNFQWETFLTPLLAVILFILVDKNLRQNWDAFIRNFLILIVTSYLTSFLVKAVWVINIFDWTKLIFALSIAIVSDTFAYIGGNIFGNKWFRGAKLAPKISPSKTWAGALIAFVITYTFASLLSFFIGFWSGSNNQIILSFVGGAILAIIAQLGDLLFSGFKRILNTKDFSSLIPIHGGIFDRVDAISLVMFFIVILFIFSG